MKKYAIPGVMMLAGHEIVSLAAMLVAVLMFLADIVHEYERRY